MGFFEKVLLLFKVLEQYNTSVYSIIRNGISIRSAQIIQNVNKVCGANISIIIDVGANKGQFAIEANRVFQSAKIISFEPSLKVYNQLVERTRHIEGMKYFQYALGHSNDNLTFYESEYSHASSLLKMTELHKGVFSKEVQIDKVSVQVRKLDDIINLDQEKGKILLKLDVQGYEKEVLLGATSLLKRIDYLLFETSFVPLYEQEPLFEEMHNFVTSLGYYLICPVGLWQKSDLQILQMDILYGKK